MAFDLVEPQSLDEALALLDPEDPGVRAIAGGTALMLMIKSGFLQPRRLVSLRRIGGIAAIGASAEGGLVLGAMARLRDVERAPAVRERAPVIAEMLRGHSNVRVRTVATVGGNLAHGDPHMDLPPVLIALDAAVRVRGAGGSRSIAVADLLSGYFETALRNDELITEVTIPPQHGRRAVYLKCTTRAADDWPALGVAISLALAGATIREARVVIAAATDRPVRIAAVERLLAGGLIGEALFREAGALAADAVEPVGDERGSAPYKKHLAGVVVRRALMRAAEVAG
jgi:carbon-monoxide dehydrogenase medium subunit